MDYPFDTVGLDSETIDTFDDTYKLLRSKFRIEHTGSIDFHLEDFEAFRGCANINIKGSYVIKNARSDCYILFVEIHKVKGAAQNCRSGTIITNTKAGRWPT